MKEKMAMQTINKKLITWTICCILVFMLYGGVLIVEAVFFNGSMRVALISVLVSSPIVIIALIVYFKKLNVTNIPLITTVGTQLIFLSAGTYLKELDFYFFVLLLALGATMIIKNFGLLIKCVLITVVIHIAASIFLLPRLEWVNQYRFFAEFLYYLYGAVFFLILTYSVEQKENTSERAYAAFSSLMNSTPNYMVITDSLNRVRYISEPMAQFAYFSSQESAVGRPLLDLFSDKNLKLMFADILNAGGFIETVMNINMNGEERHFKVVADKLSGDTGGLFIDISDITPTVNSKEAAEEAQAHAEAASASKSKFLATMSHEIRTPMNAIIGIAQIGLQDETLPEKHAVALEKIYHSGNSLLGIINDILDLSKIETGKMEISPVEYDMPSLIHDTAQLNIVRIGSKPLEFILDIDEKLPARLIGDELRIKQILNNLLSNAIKYTDKGRVKLTVNHIDLSDELVLLRFIIEDTGQGMKSEDCQKLFSEYSRFNIENNRNTEGTGIGLNITKSLVELMEGTINVKSEYGKGSTFKVTIKQKTTDCEAIGAELAEKLRSFTFSGEKQYAALQIHRKLMPHGKVLIVDDVETNLFVAEGLLSPYELQVETAISGFEAIEKVKSGKTYDIIFMDHMMPIMDGIAALQELRSMGYKGTIVALTANALAGNEEMFRQKGFDGFISKPIDMENLDEILIKFIRDKQSDMNTSENVIPKQTPLIPLNPNIIKVFLRDASKAVISLREIPVNGDIDAADTIKYSTTVHAMKSALAYIGEKELSQAALDLEMAVTKGNISFIAANTDSFIQSLETLIESMESPD